MFTFMVGTIFMKHFFTNLRNRVETEIQATQAKPENKEAQAHQCCIAFYNAYKELQKFLSTYTFSDEQEEIDYFRLQKPEICSQMIYYHEIVRIEASKPRGGGKARKVYFMGELDKLVRSLKEDSDFICYYRSGNKTNDRFYFTRHHLDFKTVIDRFQIDGHLDQRTNCDANVAKLLANDLLQKYLEEELSLLEAPNVPLLPAPQPAKLQSGLTVAQLALFFRLLSDCGLITSKPIQGIFDHVAANYQSQNRASISAASIMNKFYTFDDSTISAIEAALLKMLGCARERQ